MNRRALLRGLAAGLLAANLGLRGALTPADPIQEAAPELPPGFTLLTIKGVDQFGEAVIETIPLAPDGSATTDTVWRSVDMVWGSGQGSVVEGEIVC
jgi:hypothetical protein